MPNSLSCSLPTAPCSASKLRVVSSILRRATKPPPSWLWLPPARHTSITASPRSSLTSRCWGRTRPPAWLASPRMTLSASSPSAPSLTVLPKSQASPFSRSSMASRMPTHASVCRPSSASSASGPRMLRVRSLTPPPPGRSTNPRLRKARTTASRIRPSPPSVISAMLSLSSKRPRIQRSVILPSALCS